jgi:ferredoxin-NADP reductase
MAGAALQRRLRWVVAEVVELIAETPAVRSVVLSCPGWSGHLPGQHVDLRLTAPDGYQAQRSYSLATPSDGDRVTITVELVADGEVSPYLIDEVRVGDRLELRGPIGGYFVWEPGRGGPVQLIAGGTGIVPLMAMTRARARVHEGESVALLVSARSRDDVIYGDELDRLATSGWLTVVTTLTRSTPPGWTGPSRRVDREMIEETMWRPSDRPVSFVCGPTGFVEAVTSILVDIGYEPSGIRAERFGPTKG